MRINKNVIYFFNLQWLLLSSVVAFLDLFTKHLVMSNYMLGKSVFIFPFMNFYYIYNFGIAFSLFSEFGIKQSSLLSIVVIFIIFVLCTVLCCCIGTAYTYFFKTGYSMVVGGAIGNLIDRIRYGVVTDFIDFHIWNWHFPTFNVADLSIFVGVIMMILHNYR